MAILVAVVAVVVILVAYTLKAKRGTHADKHAGCILNQYNIIIAIYNFPMLNA